MIKTNKCIVFSIILATLPPLYSNDETTSSIQEPSDESVKHVQQAFEEIFGFIQDSKNEGIPQHEIKKLLEQKYGPIVIDTVTELEEPMLPWVIIGFSAIVGSLFWSFWLGRQYQESQIKNEVGPVGYSVLQALRRNNQRQT